ncbi:hypothetical protein [Xenorhabdus anantnagensis]|uniref:AMP-binding enzyme C-terminal domain-containing protein n=1 Tax=Xenorhabdus anantnagensis TaxID=3025875 RepID=A0ABT5LVL7_9GAMM|nr:hypothetical protein [Xenorhabdus anantnagensis]MDC9597050.1 hypothetical protein [Xenorhabdus anantnagensis]
MGRKKDVIIRGGVNISPTQIEKLMTNHPGIVNAACIAIPDRDLDMLSELTQASNIENTSVHRRG